MATLCKSSVTTLCKSSVATFCKSSEATLCMSSVAGLCKSSMARLCKSSVATLCKSSVATVCKSSEATLCKSSVATLCKSSVETLCKSSLPVCLLALKRYENLAIFTMNVISPGAKHILFVTIQNPIPLLWWYSSLGTSIIKFSHRTTLPDRQPSGNMGLIFRTFVKTLILIAQLHTCICKVWNLYLVLN